MRKLIIGAAIFGVVGPTAPALADPWGPATFQNAGWDDDDDDDDDRRYRRGHHHRGEKWRKRDGPAHCRLSNGTTGMIVGGAAGALLGRAVDTQGSRTTGTVLGAAGGALLGREVTRKQRCA